jgi:succinate dehydrogenase/fumarate reductase flavoprotein subunit
MAEWRVGWARRADGRIAQVAAPGHSVPRCCYVDFLNTGPAVAATLRRRIAHVDAIRRVSNLTVTDIVTADENVIGAVALDSAAGEPVTIAAKAVIIAAGGLTRIFRRNSASANMGGDGYALALAAGADLVDMEFVQFFPIGHLAPRLVGMDPIMWDPFRYKLGGRLLDGGGREFLADYGSDETGGYTTPRDLATYAIHREVAAGRGSPHGGVYLSFAHVPRAALEAAFGPVIGRLAQKPYRSRADAGRGRADRALPHGRHRGRRADGEPGARPLCRGRGGGRRQRRQPAVRQRHPRGAGVR